MKVTLVLLCGGLANRCNNNIKELYKVGINNETLLELIILNALKAKYYGIHFVTSDRTYEKINSIFGKKYNNIPITYVKQRAGIGVSHKNHIYPYISDACVICCADLLYPTICHEIMINNLNKKHDCIYGFRLKNILFNKGGQNIMFFESKKKDDNTFLTAIKQYRSITYKEAEDENILNHVVLGTPYGLLKSTMEDIIKKNYDMKQLYANISLKIDFTEDPIYGITYEEDVEPFKEFIRT
ncbi:hypothetical protein CPAV1605_961 [seawater metagenome]|uniref:MobA-like NTP transferase domain-containing protein n=1 Tax=seawater metagenome TaxID=1561972 RepID=A0A5E8CJ96_9ZZZZ